MGEGKPLVNLRRVLLPTQSSPRIPLHDRRTVPVRSLRPFLGFGIQQCPPVGPFRAHLLEELAPLHVGNALLRSVHWCFVV